MLRVRAQEHRATVKWEGTLKDTKGNEDSYYGVEWDDPSRGRHNGEYKGQKYFEVSQPNSGSFLRVSTVEKGMLISDFIPELIENFKFPKDYKFPTISFDNTEVYAVGNVGENLSETKTLNAANSLVGSFQVIWDILDVCPKLQTLILGHLHFIDFTDTEKKFNLKGIVLNYTNLNEKALAILLNALPMLETIDVSFCPSIPLKMLSGITALVDIHIDGMGISNFDDVSNTIGMLPNLKTLSINQNDITVIKYTPNTFMKLETLIIKSNKLASLMDLDGIMSFPCIQELQCQRNPFISTIGEIEARMLTIARFPSIKKLNGSEVASTELFESCISYLNYFAADVAKNGKGDHPRWDALCEKYGAPAMPTQKSEQKKRVKVSFIFGDQKIEKTVPLSVKIGTLSSQVAKLFKVVGTELEMAIETDTYKTRIPYTEQTLAEVGCSDGSIIHVGKVGDHLFDEVEIARLFKIRSISQQIESNE